MSAIYLDYNASTPLDPAVREVMRPLLEEAFGNPSSGHWASASAKAGLERARAQVAALLGCEADEIVFTSGGSEANNLALKGVFFARGGEPAHIVASAIEHPAIVEPCRFLERLGATVTLVPVDRFGLVDPDDIRKAIRRDTILVSLMHANNEVGAIQLIAEAARIAREHGVLFHTDAAQSVGKIETRVDDLGVDLLTIAGHKLYAPKGVGALYVRRGVTLEPLIHGAGHERGRRAGTESALLAAALGKACEVATATIGGTETCVCARPCGSACARPSAIASSSTVLPTGACPTRSTCRSSAASVRTFSLVRPKSPPRPARPATPAKSSCRRCSRRWASRPRSASARSVSALDVGPLSTK